MFILLFLLSNNFVSIKEKFIFLSFVNFFYFTESHLKNIEIFKETSETNIICYNFF